MAWGAAQVSEMQGVVAEKKQIAARAKADCEELLVNIVHDKRAADEQEKQVRSGRTCGCDGEGRPANIFASMTSSFTRCQVNAEATKIARETEEANSIASQVSAELEKALPALQEAEAALHVLTKKDISELKVRVHLR